MAKSRALALATLMVMSDPMTAREWIIRGAALAVIRDVAARRQSGRYAMNLRTHPGATAQDAFIKCAHRALWAAGDYHRFATGTVWELGEILTVACGITKGQRVLDVAAGTGNTAIRAAEAGAEVVAADLTPENFDAGRREASDHGVAVEWMEADAEALPFADASFDVVTSSVGALFAPDHRAVAREMLRVCRPGGTIGMINFTPEGLAGEFFPIFAPYLPEPPAGGESPVLWGSEPHVRQRFGAGVRDLNMVRRTYSEYAPTPQAYCTFFKETFGPVASVYEQLAGRPKELAALDSAFLDFAVRANQGEPGGPARYVYEYLLVTAHKA